MHARMSLSRAEVVVCLAHGFKAQCCKVHFRGSLVMLSSNRQMQRGGRMNPAGFVHCYHCLFKEHLFQICWNVSTATYKFLRKVLLYCYHFAFRSCIWCCCWRGSFDFLGMSVQATPCLGCRLVLDAPSTRSLDTAADVKGMAN